MLNLRLSLSDLLGSNFTEYVCRASAALGIGSYNHLRSLADEPIDFFPDSFSENLEHTLQSFDSLRIPPFTDGSPGAGSNSFRAAFQDGSAPLSGLGYFRFTESGRPAIAAKSEHYQASLGHNFPGFKLIQRASEIGISNITHNNTRGHITRLLEREIIRVVNSLKAGQEEELNAVIASEEKHVLNRVINLETGSLACEAAVKMMLARFYKLQKNFPTPQNEGKVPVFLVLADYDGGAEANYHGTTIITQMMRGMWQDFYLKLCEAGLFKVVPVKINDSAAFATTVEQFHQGKYRVAGFIHELVLMNYGGIRLEDDFVTQCHKICDENNIPVFIDEIQSCMWSPEIFLFKEYKAKPDFVSVGKGFPGGIYPASKIICTAEMDNLNQFGALVTNGQEELASLANLITLRFAEENAQYTEKISKLWETLLANLANKYKTFIDKAEGDGLLGTLLFYDAEKAIEFSNIMNNDYRIDVSVQTYKANCPPAALTKLPLISSENLLHYVAGKMDETLQEMLL